MDSQQNKVVIGLIIILVALGGVYYLGQQEIRKSIAEIEIEFSDFRVDRLSLFPPEIDITLTYMVYNPSEIPLTVSMDGMIYYGETPVAPLTMMEQTIPPEGYGEIEAQISFNGTLLQAIGDPQNQGEYQLRGSLTVVGKYLNLIPVEVTEDLSKFNKDSS